MGKQLHIYNLNPMDGLVWALLHLLYLYEIKCVLCHSRTLGKVSKKKLAEQGGIQTSAFCPWLSKAAPMQTRETNLQSTHS